MGSNPGVYHPIFVAFEKWVRTLNSGILYSEDIREYNDRVYAEFQFLLNHNYLFYLLVTNQTYLLEELVKEKKVTAEEGELILKIQEQYQIAEQNNLFKKFQQKTTKTLSKDEPITIFIIPKKEVWDIYCSLEHEYKALKYHYKCELVEVFYKVLDEIEETVIKGLADDPHVPKDIKELVLKDLGELLSKDIREELDEIINDDDDLLWEEVLIKDISPKMITIRPSDVLLPSIITNTDQSPEDDVDWPSEDAFDEEPKGAVELDATEPDDEVPDAIELDATEPDDEVPDDEVPDAIELDATEPDDEVLDDEVPDDEALDDEVPNDEALDDSPPVLTRYSGYIHRIIPMPARFRKLAEKIKSPLYDPITGKLRDESLSVYAEKIDYILAEKMSAFMPMIRAKYQPQISNLELQMRNARNEALNGLKREMRSLMNNIKGELVSWELPLVGKRRAEVCLHSLNNLFDELLIPADTKKLQLIFKNQLEQLDAISDLFGAGAHLEEYKKQFDEMRAHLSDLVKQQPSDLPSILAVGAEQRSRSDSLRSKRLGMMLPLRYKGLQDSQCISLSPEEALGLRLQMKIIDTVVCRIVIPGDENDINTLNSVKQLMVKLKDARYETVVLNDLRRISRLLLELAPDHFQGLCGSIDKIVGDLSDSAHQMGSKQKT
jgi:hypothetical protein